MMRRRRLGEGVLFAMLGFDRLTAWLRRQEPAIGVALALTVVTRLWLAAGDHSVFWPDEIYQSLEPAHRLAFGYGLLPWEFRDGARSWAFPALIAGPLKVLGLFHVQSPLAFVLTARLIMVLVTLAGTGAGIEYARRLGGKSAALIAAFALALYPPLLAYSHRTLQEDASAPLIVMVPLLLLARTPRAASWAGLVVGIASLLRFQCAFVAGTFVVALVFERRWEDLKAYLKAGVLVAAAGGLLDWFTWGRPFHSFITYVQFNLIRSGASTFGVSPRSYFLTTLWTASGPAILLIGIGLVVAGFSKARASAAAVAIFVLLHSAIPHKAFRFLLPVMPLMLCVSAVGLASLLARRETWKFGPAVVTGLLALGFIRAARAATYERFGQYAGTTGASGSVWDTEEEPNLLLADAAGQSDLCGVLMLGVRAAFTGGYSYLHRHVPLLYRFQACDEAKAANYVIAATSNGNIPPAYHLVRTRRGYGLYRRAGSCETKPTDFRDALDGADDMGLDRAPILQPDPSELRISAGSSASAFTRGFGHGEHLECRYVRWALGQSAQMAFPLEPSGRGYMLSFTAQPYGRALPQAARVALNGKQLVDFQLEQGWRGYQAYVPGSLLKRGRNTLDFAFARAARAGGNDTRVLAVLFDQIVLAPADTSVTIDAGTDGARRFLGSGFSSDESNEGTTFVWSDGPKSELTVTLREALDPMVFELVGQPYHRLVPLKVDVAANGKPVGSFTAESGPARHVLLIPAGVLKAGLNQIDLSYASTIKPSESEPGSTDTRDLAFQYDRFVLAPLPASTHIDLGTPGARAFEAEGFSFDEEAGDRRAVWSDGPVSKLWFRTGVDSGDRCSLHVTAMAFAPLVPLKVTVSLNGERIGEFSPTIEFQTHTLDLPSSALDLNTNTLEFRYSRTARPRDSNPTSSDERQLAVRFDRVDIECAESGEGHGP